MSTEILNMDRSDRLMGTINLAEAVFFGNFLSLKYTLFNRWCQFDCRTVEVLSVERRLPFYSPLLFAIQGRL